MMKKVSLCLTRPIFRVIPFLSKQDYGVGMAIMPGEQDKP